MNERSPFAAFDYANGGGGTWQARRNLAGGLTQCVHALGIDVGKEGVFLRLDGSEPRLYTLPSYCLARFSFFRFQYMDL